MASGPEVTPYPFFLVLVQISFFVIFFNAGYVQIIMLLICPTLSEIQGRQYFLGSHIDAVKYQDT